MLGFLTLASFIAAVANGSWYWLGFVIMLAVYASKQSEEKDAKTQTSSSPPPAPPPSHTPPSEPSRSAPASTLPAIEQSMRLVEICDQFNATNYFVSERIPAIKLTAALNHYPLAGGGSPLALIDTTPLGSAYHGMLIAENGISWRNGGVHAKSSTLTWDELSELDLSIVGPAVHIGRYALFDASGSALPPQSIEALLSSLASAVPKTVPDKKPKPQPTGPVPKAPKPPLTTPPSSQSFPVNVCSADFETLMTLPGISAENARLLIQRRKEVFPITSLNEMAAVLSLPPHVVDQLRSLVTFATDQMPQTPNNDQQPSGVNVNMASFELLLTLQGIGAADAKILIRHRESVGPFATMDELEAVLNLKPHVVERLRPLVMFSVPKSPEPQKPKGHRGPIDF